MMKQAVTVIALTLAACGGAQTPSEAEAERRSDYAESEVDREEQETEAAEEEAEQAEEVEEIIDTYDDDAVQEAADIVEENN